MSCLLGNRSVGNIPCLNYSAGSSLLRISPCSGYPQRQGNNEIKGAAAATWAARQMMQRGSCPGNTLTATQQFPTESPRIGPARAMRSNPQLLNNDTHAAKHSTTKKYKKIRVRLFSYLRSAAGSCILFAFTNCCNNSSLRVQARGASVFLAVSTEWLLRG